MAVKVVDGDLFSTKAKYICHQVNCQGKMGSGVARQIREKYPTVYQWYKVKCSEGAREKERFGVSKSPLLGQVQMVYKEDNLPHQCPAKCLWFSQKARDSAAWERGRELS